MNMNIFTLQVHFPVRVDEPEKKHVLAIVFFTPSDWKSNETAKHLMVQGGPIGPRGEFSDGNITLRLVSIGHYTKQILVINQKNIFGFSRNISMIFLVTQKGEAYIYNCPYSSLCRQVVIDDEGRTMEFDFKDMDNPTVELLVNA